MTRNRTVALALVVCGLAWSGCWRQEKRLDLHQILGHTPEELIERWGEPKQYHKDPGVYGKFGFATWPNVDSVRVNIVITGGRVTWVTYQFSAMEPFDEARAFAMISAAPDQSKAKQLPSSPGAKRWEPFEAYPRLTVNPATKLVVVGKDPLRLGPDDVPPEAAADTVR